MILSSSPFTTSVRRFSFLLLLLLPPLLLSHSLCSSLSPTPLYLTFLLSSPSPPILSSEALSLSRSYPLTLSTSPPSHYLFLLPSPGLFIGFLSYSIFDFFFFIFILTLPSFSGSLCLLRCAWAPISTLLFESQGHSVSCICDGMGAVFNSKDMLIIRPYFCPRFMIFQEEKFGVSDKHFCFKASSLLHLATACTVHTLPLFSLFPLSLF